MAHSGTTDATDVPAAQYAAHSQAWLPGADEDALGSRGSEPTPQEGASAPQRPDSFEARGGLTAEDLHRRRRLTRAAEIQAVLSGGTRRRTPRLEILWCSNDHGHPRLGVITPRFGRSAVARNQLRRRLREHARRRLLPHLHALDIVIRARPPAYTAGLADLRHDLDQWRAGVTP
jgi:ribonuclease P protein component